MYTRVKLIFHSCVRVLPQLHPHSLFLVCILLLAVSVIRYDRLSMFIVEVPLLPVGSTTSFITDRYNAADEVDTTYDTADKLDTACGTADQVDTACGTAD